MVASITSRYLQVGRFLGSLRGPCQDKAYHCKDVLNRRQPAAEILYQLYRAYSACTVQRTPHFAWKQLFN